MSELTVREIRERKSALEGEIAEAIKRFEIESGVNVSGLYLNLIDISTFTCREDLHRVSVSIEF
jgi:hypothetical protein